MKNIGLLSLLLLFVFSSCRKDTNDVSVTQKTPDPTVEQYVPQVDNITAGVIGFIVDENEMPVADATVKLNNQTLTTDEFGHFFIENITMNALGTLVQVEKGGYFDGSRRFFPTEGGKSRVKIQLLAKNFDDSFDAATGGIVTMNGGAMVEFTPSSIKTANGDAYTGMVQVATKWMDPSLAATLNQMPGNLQGINEQVEEVALGTYGMIAVELEGAGGEPLNIASGSTATITMPVPASLLSGAPAEIPLWSYNETQGLWVEEAKATLQNGAYVGEVTHFSFWNCDIPMDYINLEMTLVDDNGNPLNNYLVTLTTNGDPLSSGSGYTDQNGIVSGPVPANEVLTMEVLDPCGEVLSTQNIGGFDVDTDLGNVTISGVNVNMTTITGNLLDCSSVPITNGLVIVSFQGQNVYHYTSSSNFSMSFTTCASTIDVEVVGVNMVDLEQSDAVTVPANAETDLGDVNVCGSQLQNYISVTIDGVTAIYESPFANDQNGTTYISAQSAQGYINFNFDGTTAGNYDTSNALGAINNSTLGWNFNNSNSFSTFEVIEYGTNLVGTASGVFDDNGTMVDVTCTFNITL